MDHWRQLVALSQLLALDESSKSKLHVCSRHLGRAFIAMTPTAAIMVKFMVKMEIAHARAIMVLRVGTAFFPQRVVLGQVAMVMVLHMVISSIAPVLAVAITSMLENSAT